MARTSGSISQPQIPIFNGKNYDYWSIKMKTSLCSQGIWNFVENGFPELANQQAYQALSQAEKDLLEENKKKDAKALFFIQQAMEESIFPKVAAARRSKQAWDSFQTTYQGIGKVIMAKLQILRRDFENLQMKDSDSIDSFVTHAMLIVNQLRSYGDTIEDQKIVEKIVRSLPGKFDAVVIAIQEAKDLSQLLVDELMGRKVWVYFLKYKSDVFAVFMEFKAKVEKESGYYIKTLRTDQGGEYISIDFQNFCKENGINK
ncbi:uncharacterized protein LOC131860011 [Cryptomeria japonica]|uniref:uncharacterized protein LOC131860011 n=1 Tax=Cryptomeria japonica TaxID=3369 RepID=UPI0027DA8876|nr:uncharacterized protein LOC131860011 [Cryptomeria japonica]